MNLDQMLGVANQLRSGVGQRPEPISIDVIDASWFVDGQMVEHWGVPDRRHRLITALT